MLISMIRLVLKQTTLYSKLVKVSWFFKTKTLFSTLWLIISLIANMFKVSELSNVNLHVPGERQSWSLFGYKWMHVFVNMFVYAVMNCYDCKFIPVFCDRNVCQVSVKRIVHCSESEQEWFLLTSKLGLTCVAASLTIALSGTALQLW